MDVPAEIIQLTLKKTGPHKMMGLLEQKQSKSQWGANKTASSTKEIHELRKKISILKWDIPHLKDKKLKVMREKELSSAKNKLAELLQSEEVEGKL